MDVLDRYPKHNSSVKHIKTVRILNNSTINEEENARVKVCLELPIYVIETIEHVNADPIFAPIIIEIAPSRGMTPLATIATDKLVVADELCIKAVRIIPSHNPVNGFFSWEARVVKMSLS